MRTILRYLGEIGGGMLMTLPLAVFMRMLASLRRKKIAHVNKLQPDLPVGNESVSTTTSAHEITSALFIMYCGGLATVTILSHITSLTFDISGMKVNLIPFNFVYEMIFGAYKLYGNTTAVLINVIGNIAVFIPFGFMLSLLWRGAHWRKAALISAAASLFIELCQLPQISRVTDIDDIILNTAGGLLGYLLYTLIKPEIVGKFRSTTKNYKKG